MARIFSNCFVKGWCSFIKLSDPVEGHKEPVLMPKNATLNCSEQTSRRGSEVTAAL
jgi:hypothetical protein